MQATLKQENFSHAKCLSCGYFGLTDKFNPKTVDLEDSNHPFIKFTLSDESKKTLKDSPLKIGTVNFNCPICNTANVDPDFVSEMQ